MRIGNTQRQFATGKYKRLVQKGEINMSMDLEETLLYKKDFSKAKERFRAFWEHEIIDRICLAVTAPGEEQVSLPQPANEREHPVTWQANTNPDYVVRLYNAVMSNTYYGGEALPVAWAPGNLLYAAYGGNARFDNGTVWVDPNIHSCEDWENYCFNPGNQFVQDTLRITMALSEDAPGKYLVGSPGVFGPLDAMSLMRGMSDFVMELALPECADFIQKAHQKVMKGFKYISEEIYKISSTVGQDGCMVCPGFWAPGRINNWSADFSSMIGPKLFRQWMVPELEEMARFLEFNMYHLDGPDAVRHLPMLLEIDEIRGIQYTRGAGHSLSEALPVYKQIQEGGKVQYVDCAYDEVEIVLRELDPRGLLIFTDAPSIEAADMLLKKAEHWSLKKK